MQDALKRRVAIENPSHYLSLEGHDWDEPAFLHELVRRTGCGLLVDVNNLYVSACNTGTSATDLIDRIAPENVMEVHLAGHHEDPAVSRLLIDSHDTAVSDPVWALYGQLLARVGPRPTLIERDGDLPPFEMLMAERQRAHDMLLHSGHEVAA